MIAAVAAAVGMGVVALWVLLANDESVSPEGDVAAVLADARPSAAPFEGLTEADVAVDGDCLRVVVADERSERVQGLRAVTDLGPYDGMLFVADREEAGRFTMADTLIPLDIGFYAPDGTSIARLAMVPCPLDESECPTYGPDAAFLLALETPAGLLSEGDLGPCA